MSRELRKAGDDSMSRKKKQPQTAMKRFILRRQEDVSGTSGTGVVAEGCSFSTGYCSLTWLGPLTSMAFYHSPDVMMQIHGHGGLTTLEYIDG